MTPTIEVTIDYFAQLRELAGLASESMTLAGGDMAELYQQLASRYGFDLPQSDIKVAVNDEFVDWAYALKSGDRVVFIPPVTGG